VAGSDDPSYVHRFGGSGNKSDTWRLQVGSRETQVESSNFLSNRNFFRIGLNVVELDYNSRVGHMGGMGTTWCSAVI
jgi:hypothetical protein